MEQILSDRQSYPAERVIAIDGNIVAKMIRLYRPSNETLQFNVMEVHGVS